MIYPILAWILPRLQELQKRAYLARFLVNIEVPAEYFQDEGMRRESCRIFLRVSAAVTDTFNQYKELQEAFKETHKQVEGLRKQARNPVDIRQRLGKLEEEKDQLSTKILNVQRRTQDMVCPGDLSLLESFSSQPDSPTLTYSSVLPVIFERKATKDSALFSRLQSNNSCLQPRRTITASSPSGSVTLRCAKPNPFLSTSCRLYPCFESLGCHVP